jgi:hypothetical protein
MGTSSFSPNVSEKQGDDKPLAMPSPFGREDNSWEMDSFSNKSLSEKVGTAK